MSSQQERASVLQWIFYSWVSPLLAIGSQRMKEREKLQPEDLLELPSFENPKLNAATIEEFWKEEKESENPSLQRALRRAFGLRVLVGGLLRLLSDGSAFAAPFVLREFIGWLTDDSREDWEGFVYVLVLTLCNVVMSMSLNAGSHNTLTAFTQMSTGLQVMIYDKSLELGNNHGATGLVTTLHTTDASRFIEMAMFVHGLWVSPILVVAATIALYFFIGWAGLIAVGLMIIFVPVQVKLMGKMQMFQREIIARTDKRIAAVSEVFQAIRITKFMSWENRFTERIFQRRGDEVSFLEKVYNVRAVVAVIIQSMPVVVTFTLFACAYGLGDGINVKDVFPALSMLNVIRIPVMFIPMSINKLMFLQVSMERIQKFLLGKSHTHKLGYPRSESEGLAADNLTVLKADETPILKDVSFSVGKGELSIITGPTGSGKSTLVNALIGEADVTPESNVRACGTISYVPQEPWIMNANVRDNIILNQPFDQEKYDNVIRCCQLTADLEQLPEGDETEIGERGINVSGGQKQRIAFARAVYSDRDIVIMDDPLSAVDAHVCHALFHECICGALAEKTRVLVTHQVQFLSNANSVVAMKDCAVDFSGSPSEMPGVTPSEASPSAPSPSAASPSAKGKTDSANEPIAAPTKKGKLMTKEDMFFGDVAWSIYGWYMEIGKYGWVAATLLIFTLYRASTVLVDMWLAVWAGEQDAFGRTYTGKEYLMFFGIFVAISIVLVFFRSLIYARFMLNVASNSHHALVQRVIRAPTSFFDTTPMGRIINRFTKDMDVLDNKLPEVVQMVLNLAFTILGTLFLVSFAAPYILVLIPFMLFIYYNMYVYYSQTVRGVKRIEGIQRSPMMAIMSETLGGLSTIRAYGLNNFFSSTHSARAAAATQPVYCTRACQRWLAARTEIIGSSILLVAGILSAMSKVLGDTDWNVSVEPSVAALSLTYALATTNAITFMTRMMAELESDMSATERVYEYSHDIPQEHDVSYAAHGDATAVSTDPTAEVALIAPDASWPSQGEITFKNVDLRYREGLPLVLQDVSFTISPGNKVGIVGRTGSGKSTIMLALFRMVEVAAGSILLDGRDTTTVTLSDLRSNITIIPQDPVLFGGSIRSNLDPFDQFDDDALWEVIAKVGMDNRLKKEDNGLLEEVEERGANFSVGQRQLLCLARALLKKCSVLLMDEATASVDFETDALIQRVIREEFKKCTVLTIAHRLATIIDSDVVIVMNAGSVQEMDHPATLLDENDGAFYDMVSQLGEEQFAALSQQAKEAKANA